MPKKPPKAWWNKKEKEVKKDNPDYTEKQVSGTVGKIWWENMSEADRQKVLKTEKKAAEFRNLFSPKYVKWIEIEAELMAQNNYGPWSSVEEANALVDRAITDLSNTIKAGVESEVKRIVDDKREDIVVDMTENIVEGPDLPQMGPDQVLPAQPMQAPQQEALSPQTLSPPPAKKLAQVFNNLDLVLEKCEEGWEEAVVEETQETQEKAPMSEELKTAFNKAAMLELRPLGSNVTEIETDEAIVLFSYSTPVAYQDKATGAFYRTSERYSVTTSRHINKWLEGAEAAEVDQAQLDNLVRTAGIEDMLKKNKEEDDDKKDDDKKDDDKKDDKDKKRVTPEVDKKKKVFPFKDKKDE
jgi:hypothetical protein